eukprot:925692_1
MTYYQSNAEIISCDTVPCVCNATVHGETCTLDCTGQAVCRNKVLTCRDGDPCIINRDKRRACQGASITCPMNSDCTVYCIDDQDTCHGSAGAFDISLNQAKSYQCVDGIAPDSGTCPPINEPYVPAPFTSSPTASTETTSHTPTTLATSNAPTTRIISSAPTTHPITSVPTTFTPNNVPTTSPITFAPTLTPTDPTPGPTDPTAVPTDPTPVPTIATSAPVSAPSRSPIPCTDLISPSTSNVVNVTALANNITFIHAVSPAQQIDGSDIAVFASQSVYLNTTLSELHCGGLVSCFETNVYCASDQTHCNVLCNGYSSCIEATIHANNTQNVHIICNGQDTCKNVQIYVQNV